MYYFNWNLLETFRLFDFCWFKKKREKAILLSFFSAALGALLFFLLDKNFNSSQVVVVYKYDDVNDVNADSEFFYFRELAIIYLSNLRVHSIKLFNKICVTELSISEESIVAKTLRRNVRVLCWIMSGPGNTKKAMAVNATWAPKCNKYFFVTADNGLPSVDFNVSAGRDHLWEKTQRAFKYLYKTELNNYDWFLKADDDTFVIMENLRFMLLAYSPDDPIWFGCKLKPQVKHGYMSGGAGYVLSREALKRFVEDALNNTEQCRPNDAKDEDVYVGKCLESVHIVAGDSRDIHGNHRMLPLEPALHLDVTGTRKNNLLNWFHKNIFYPYNRYRQPLSDYQISFHYVDRPHMYALYNFFYRNKIVGVTDGLLQLTNTRAENGTELIDQLRSMSQNTSRSFADMVAERDSNLILMKWVKIK